MHNVYFLLRKLEFYGYDEKMNILQLALNLVSEHCNVYFEFFSSSNSIEDLYSSTKSKNEMLQCKMNIIVYIVCSI